MYICTIIHNLIGLTNLKINWLGSV